jgi:hypothetical protein
VWVGPTDSFSCCLQDHSAPAAAVIQLKDVLTAAK